MKRIEKKSDIANLPGYSELVRDWQRLTDHARAGFASREDYADWIVELEGVSMGRAPQELISFLLSSAFIEAAWHQLSGTESENEHFRIRLLLAAMKRSLGETFQFFSAKAVEQAKSEHRYEREEQP